MHGILIKKPQALGKKKTIYGEVNIYGDYIVLYHILIPLEIGHLGSEL